MTWAGRRTKRNWRALAKNDDRLQPVLLLLKDALRLVDRPNHRRLFRIGELTAGGHAPRELPDGDERARDLAAAGIGVGVTRNEQLLEERQRRAAAADVEGVETLPREEATQQRLTDNRP